MQFPYSEDIDVQYLSRLFDNTSECYKFFWFQAIVTKVLEGKILITYEELIDEMIADAWYMVTEYHLNLGPKDTLENLVHYIQGISQMKSSEKKENIISYLKKCTDKEVAKRKRMLTKNVVRVSGTNRPVESYMLKELILEGKNRYYDSEPYNGMSVTDEEIKKLCKNMKEIALKNTWQDSDKAKIKNITKNTLISWGILAEEYGLPEPELIDFAGDFRVNMYRKVKEEFGVNDKTTQTTIQTTTQTTQSATQTTQSATLKLSENDKAILEIVYDQPAMSQKEYALELGWTVDRVKYYLRKMKTQKIINRVGSIHNGHWEVQIKENEWQR